MENHRIKKGVFFVFVFFSFVVNAQTVAPDEDTNSDLSCPSSGQFENTNTRNVDIQNSVNVGTVDDRSCYADYSESNVNGSTWGVYNITDGSNHWDAPNTLQPRIERSLPRSQATGVGSYAKFTGTVRILEVGDASGTGNDGTYIMQAKGKHTGGGGSPDPAICLYLAKPVLDGSGNQVSFDIYREQINFRGGSGASGRTLVFLTNVLKNAETNITLEVGFRQDPNDVSKKIHYSDAIIGGNTFNWNIPEPEKGTESGIRYGAYRVKGGRAQIRWANTTYQKNENAATDPPTSAQTYDFKTDQDALGWVKGNNTLSTTIVTEGLEIAWAADNSPKIKNASVSISKTNKFLALSLTNTTSEPINIRLVYPNSSEAGNKFYSSGSWSEIPANVTTSSTYYFEIDEAEWNGHTSNIDYFEIQMRDTGGTNRDDASIATTSSIIIQKIELLNAIPTPSVTHTSTKAGDWTDTTVWDGGAVPTSADDVIVNHAVRIKNGVTAEMKSLSIGASPAQLRVDDGSVVTVSGTVSIDRSQDGMAFYAQSGSLGAFTYGSLDAGSTDKRVFVRHRLPKNDAWALISSPVQDSRINEITGKNSTHIVTKGGKFSIASYNDGNASGSKYVYYSSAPEPDNTVQIEEGEGHLLKKNNTGDNSKPDYYQRGVLRSAFPVDITISDAGNGFNLLGNPLIGYLNVNDAANATNNILRVNGTNGSDILAEDTIWIWDSINESWITHNLNSTSYKMPGIQGFFVKAKAGGGTFSFTKAMQSDTGNTYLKSSSLADRFEINLAIYNGNKKISTSIKYIDNMTTDFDNGYDSSLFGGYASELELYTNLVSNNSNKKLAIQSLPNANLEDMIVPVGISAATNSEITFSTEALNVPADYKIFLEDRLNNTFIRLDEANSEYTTTVSDKFTDGRFYLHTSTKSVLNVGSELLNSISIYKSNASTLKIVGLSQGKTSVKIFNLLGKKVLSSNFNANGVKEISLPKLSSGVYVVQLETETGKLNKKIVLE